jgi:hypothetical protein
MGNLAYLVDPVRVQYPQIRAPSPYTLFSRRPQTSLIFKLVDTLTSGFAVHLALWNGSLATTTADTNAINYVTLLGLIAEAASFVRTRWPGRAVNDVQLS